MADASYVQPSFLGGEWSPWIQGRLDLSKYRTAMNVCYNGLPLEEGAWTRRPGTMLLGFTHNSAQARVIGYEYQENLPSILEFTANTLRIWNGFTLLGGTISTPYTTFDKIQKLWFISLGQTASGLQAILLCPNVAPQVLTVTNPGASPTFTLAPANFADGPYLDAVNGAIATLGPSIESQIFTEFTSSNNWAVGTTYTIGQVVEYSGQIYVSIPPTANVGNNPAITNEWLHLVYTPPYPAWVGGSNYNTGDIVSYTGSLYASWGQQYTSWDNTSIPSDETNWSLLSTQNVTINLSGLLNFVFSFAAWSSTNIYGIGDVASYSGNNYISLKANNTNQNPTTATTYWQVTSAGAPFSPAGAQATDVGRLMRFFSQPPVWTASTAYPSGAVVTYAGSSYTAQTTTTNNQPDISLNQWQPSPTASIWTWGIITAVTSSVAVQVQLLGPALVYNTSITVFQVGAFSNTTGWPTCGTFFQGRLWLAGSAPNRIDSSVSDNVFTFSPTNQDGTVADNNGISEIFNSQDNELVQWMIGNQQGLLIGTITREWLIFASTAAEPLTPASSTIAPVTHYGGAAIQPRVAGLATVFVQRHQKALMEMVTNVFSGKYNAPNLGLAAQHLISGGIVQVEYQEELTPIIWVLCGDNTLIGCTYRRITAFQTDNPVLMTEPSTYAAWHRHALGSGRKPTSIAKTFNPTTNLPTLAMTTIDVNGNYAVEVFTDFFDVTGNLYDAWFLDTGVVPTSLTTTTVNGVIGTQVSGLTSAIGGIVTAWIAGLDCGDYLVASGGTIQVPYGAAGGLYTAAYLAQVAVDPTYSGNYGVKLDGGITVPAVIGFTFTSQGQTVRPALAQEAGSRNGPAQGKTRRNHQLTALLQGTQGISFGTTFTHLYPFLPTAYINGPIYPNNQLYSGVYWQTIDDDNSFDGMLAWQISRPYPATVVNIGGFLHTQDR